MPLVLPLNTHTHTHTHTKKIQIYVLREEGYTQRTAKVSHSKLLFLCVRACVRVQKCLRFDPDVSVWSVKQQVMCSLNESLWDVYNYGLFQPAGEGRDACFLEEERSLREYPQSLEKGVPYLEVL
uniref:Talin N-terminal F0 domain-containing protein n=1 Tax=Electrophorus electricus TaxID=8005 RepID=A0A4W4F085_ELEEL